RPFQSRSSELRDHRGTRREILRDDRAVPLLELNFGAFQAQGGSVTSGFLVIADISGFTEYLTKTELEHGPAVTADLLDAAARALQSGLQIEGLQGDAVFAIGDDATFGAASKVVDLAESAYIAFRRRQRDMRAATTCTCSACRNIPNLAL